MLAEDVSNRLDVSLTLTFSSQASDLLEKSLGLQLALLSSVALVMAMSAVSSILSQGTVSGGMGTLSIARRTFGLVVVRLVMKTAGTSSSSSTATMARPHGDALLEAWPTIEGVFLSSVLLVFFGFIDNQVKRMGGSPEVDRLVTSVQWVFADNVGSLMGDQRVKRDIVIAGVLIFPRILNDPAAPVLPTDVWLRGLAMAWVNTLVQIVVPDDVSQSRQGIDIVAALALACGIHVFGDTVLPSITPLLGYVEWHITSIIMQAFASRSVSSPDVILASGAAYALVTYTIPFVWSRGSKVPGVSTLLGVSALVLANTAASWWMTALKGAGALDSLAVILATVAVARTVSKLVRSWSQQAQ